MTEVCIGVDRPDEMPRIFELLEECNLPHDGLEGRSVEFASACPNSARAMMLDLRAA